MGGMVSVGGDDGSTALIESREKEMVEAEGTVTFLIFE